MKTIYLILLLFISIFILSCENNTDKSNIKKHNDNITTHSTSLNAGKLNNHAMKVSDITKKQNVKSIKNNDNKIERYLGDLKKIKEKKTLRVLIVKGLEYDSLPRKLSLMQQEFDYLKKFAKLQNLKFKFIFKERFKDLIPALINGEGDIIAANMTVTEARKKKIDFTNSLTAINEIIISRKGDDIKSLNDLKNRTIWVKKSSSFFESVMKIKSKIPEIKVSLVPENIEEEVILNNLANKKYDLTILDDNKLEEILLTRDEFQKNIAINKHRTIAWGIRKNSPNLKKGLNKFISVQHLDLRVAKISIDDFDKILKKGYIRVLTRNNSMTYFLYKGKALGFEYELAKFFAENYHLRVEFIIPPSRDKLIPWLLEGKGDIIAASMTTNAINNDKIAYSQKYDEITEDVVASLKSNISKKEELKDKTFYIRKKSSYYKTLLDNQKKLGYKIKFIPEDEETEEILEGIESDKYELTLADSSIVNREISMGTKVKKVFSLKAGSTYSWIVRKNNPKLLQAINDFFKKSYKGLKFNIIYNKYFLNIRRITKLKKFISKEKGKISNYDALFKKYAKKYGFNWLMIASQSFQESRFNPKAKSWVGAMGLMQVMPKTGKMLGFTDLYNPDNGVHAGTKYMSWLKKRFNANVPAKDRLWFALASYNAGYGHVLDAIKVAKVMGLNPNKWFNNVELAMTKLSKRKFRKHTKYGYCKCKEPIAYVSLIKTRYETYEAFISEE